MSDITMTAGCKWARAVAVTEPDGDAFNLTGRTVSGYLYVRGERYTVTTAVASPATGGIINASMSQVPDHGNHVGELRIFAAASGEESERVATYTVRIEQGEAEYEDEES